MVSVAVLYDVCSRKTWRLWSELWRRQRSSKTLYSIHAWCWGTRWRRRRRKQKRWSINITKCLCSLIYSILYTSFYVLNILFWNIDIMLMIHIILCEWSNADLGYCRSSVCQFIWLPFHFLIDCNWSFCALYFFSFCFYSNLQ